MALALTLGPASSFFINPPANARSLPFLSNPSSPSSTFWYGTTSSSGASASGLHQTSNFSGNQREPTARDVQVIDEMIDKLSTAQIHELPSACVKALKIVGSPKFFVRIAERSDMARTEDERALLASLADNLASTLSAVVSAAEDKMEDRAEAVTRVLQAAAEPGTGEFLVPLTASRTASMKAALLAVDPSDLDEPFLNTLDAYVKKSSEDGLDGMVVILQKLMQLYAGVALKKRGGELIERVGAAVAESEVGASTQVGEGEKGSEESAAAKLLGDLFDADADCDWDAMLSTSVSEAGKGGTVPSTDLVKELQKVVEGVVLGMPNGGMEQRICAEYCRELASRVEKIGA